VMLPLLVMKLGDMLTKSELEFLSLLKSFF
jgi:hypothetical protein